MTVKRLTGIFGAAALGVGLVAGGAAAVPIQWTGPDSNGHYYELITDAVTITQARAAAAAARFTPTGSSTPLQGHLVTITSQAEQDFVRNSVQNATEAYIGFSDNPDFAAGAFETGADAAVAAPSPGWRWIDRPQDPNTYRNWNAGEPNDWQDSNPGEDFVVIRSEDGLWNDLGAPTGDTDPRAYIIEYSDPVPEPVGLGLVGLTAVGLLARRRRA